MPIILFGAGLPATTCHSCGGDFDSTKLSEHRLQCAAENQPPVAVSVQYADDSLEGLDDLEDFSEFLGTQFEQTPEVEVEEYTSVD